MRCTSPRTTSTSLPGCPPRWSHSRSRNSIGKPRQSGPPTRRQDSIPCLVDLLRRWAAGSCIDALRPRSLPWSSLHCRINVAVARLASLLSGTSYLRQRVAVSSIKALLSPLLEAPPPFLLDNAVRVDAADIKGNYFPIYRVEVSIICM